LTAGYLLFLFLFAIFTATITLGTLFTIATAAWAFTLFFFVHFYHPLFLYIHFNIDKVLKWASMALIVVDKKLTKEDIKASREDYPEYIKITTDLKNEVVIIGGEYHADAEKILTDKFNSKRSDIWGGGYNISNGTYEVNAILNLKPGMNDSTDILDPEVRNHFLEVVKNKLGDISLLI
jgi:hypothetical protein